MYKNNPYIVKSKGIMAAIIQDGIFEGLPLCLAVEASANRISLEDIKIRGWIYA